MITPALFLLAQASTAPARPGGIGDFAIPIVCFFVIVYFGILRPQQKRTKDQQNLLTSLKTGDKVVTNGGIHGIVANIKDGATLSLKIADNVRIEIDKSAIASIERDKEREAAPAVAAVAAKS